MFYDAPYGYDFPPDYVPRFEPMLERIDYLEFDDNFDALPVQNRYYTSVHYTDSLIGRVLSRLEGAPRRALVVITGDHAQELNDNGLNYWGHNSNFTDAQIAVPLAIVGVGVKPGENWQAATSHVDIAPTLLRHYLGVNNALDEFSSGADLLGRPPSRDWLISANYSGYAIIERDAITQVSASGAYRHLDRTNRPRDAALNDRLLGQALIDMSRFYR